jgi:hypothetical protein
MLLDPIMFWNIQWTTTVMCKIHHINEFRFLNFIKWLVAGDNPLSEELFELFLIPWTLTIAS